MRFPFSCFFSNGYDATLPRHSDPTSSSASSRGRRRQQLYSTSALPPLQATFPASAPADDSDRRPMGVRKESIGPPTGFEHVRNGWGERPGERGGEGVANDEQNQASPVRVRPRPYSTGTAALSPSAPTSPARGPLISEATATFDRPARRLQKRASVPVPVPPSSSSSPRAVPVPGPAPLSAPAPDPLAGAAAAAARVKRKAAPVVTASVIRSAGGAEIVARTGPVPSKLFKLSSSVAGTGEAPVSASPESGEAEAEEEERTKSSRMLLHELFSRSELEALGAASSGERASRLEARLGSRFRLTTAAQNAEGDADAAAAAGEEEEGGARYETGTVKAFENALKDIEAALRRELSEDV